jgi:hypothetical protein
LLGVEILDLRVAPTSQEILAVAGIQSAATNTFTRIATLEVDPSKYPPSQVKFRATLEATTGQTAEARLYNVTDGGPVSGSTLTGSTEDPTSSEVVVTLPGTLKLYEVQLRLGSANGGSDLATCTNAKIVLTWG